MRLLNFCLKNRTKPDREAKFKQNDLKVMGKRLFWGNKAFRIYHHLIRTLYS